MVLLKSPKKKVIYVTARKPQNIRSGTDIRIQNYLQFFNSNCEFLIFEISNLNSTQVDFLKNSIYGDSGIRNLSTSDLAAVILGKEPPYFFYFSENLFNRLDKLITDFNPDIVLYQRLEVVSYAKLKDKYPKIKFILELDELQHKILGDFSDINTSAALRMRSLYSKRIETYEKFWIDVFDEVWVSSVDERNLLDSIFVSPEKFRVVPNVVDLDYYDFFLKEECYSDELFFPGNFLYRPNLMAFEFITSELLDLIPDFKVKIAGSGQPTHIRNYISDKVSNLGEVDDMREEFRKSFALIVPIALGGGTRLKVLEAMALGLPVISTQIGVRGLNLVPGVHYLQAESAEQFAKAAYHLKSNNQIRVALIQNSRSYIERNYDFNNLSHILKNYLKIT